MSTINKDSSFKKLGTALYDWNSSLEQECGIVSRNKTKTIMCLKKYVPGGYLNDPLSKINNRDNFD